MAYRKILSIIQSNYIPWKGYFDIINKSDLFMVFDEVQYTVRDWRNRNMIKTPHGPQWLTIPVIIKGKRLQKIKDTKIASPKWNIEHWKTIEFNYSKSTFFKKYSDFFKELYLNSDEKYLSQINIKFIKAINKLLDIKTKIVFSSDYNLSIKGKTEKLISLCQQTKSDCYISGPSAKNYISGSLFKKSAIDLLWMNYNSYKKYPQLHPPFSHQVTILDLIFNTGPKAKKYLTGKLDEDK